MKLRPLHPYLLQGSDNLCYLAVLANCVCYSKTPDESSFKEEGLTWTHSSGVQFILEEKQGLATIGQIVSAVRRQRVRKACCLLLFLSLFNSGWVPSPSEMAQARVKVGLSTSSNLVNPAEIAPKILSLVIVDPVTLTAPIISLPLLNFPCRTSVLCHDCCPLLPAGLRPECPENGLHSMLLLTV